MPLRFDVEEYLGTNSDGSRSDEFCYYCPEGGKIHCRHIHVEMIDIWIKNIQINIMNMQIRTILRKN